MMDQYTGSVTCCECGETIPFEEAALKGVLAPATFTDPGKQGKHYPSCPVLAV